LKPEGGSRENGRQGGTSVKRRGGGEKEFLRKGGGLLEVASGDCITLCKEAHKKGPRGEAMGWRSEKRDGLKRKGKGQTLGKRVGRAEVGDKRNTIAAKILKKETF